MIHSIENRTIGRLSFKNIILTCLSSEIFGPLPVITRYSRVCLDNMGKSGVVEAGLHDGQLVVITRSRLLV